jgi:short-subunit dehydrogenase
MKNILITGASSGIGAELAKQYAQKGTYLFLCGRNRERLLQTQDLCVEKGAEVEVSCLDVCDRQGMFAWITRVSQEFGIDLIIANAGISGGFSGQSLDDIEQDYKIFDTNLGGVLNTIYPVLPHMIEKKSGHIAIISSLASFIPMPSAPAYSASKVAVRFYGEALSMKLKPHNIAVSVICPGFIKSRMTDANQFPMPFLMETDEAARYIIKRLFERKFRIDFPLPVFIPLRILSCLPSQLVRLIFACLPDKKNLPKI